MKCKDILSKHNKFFSKAKRKGYLWDHLLVDLPPIAERVHKDVVEKGQSFIENYAKMRAEKGLKCHAVQAEWERFQNN